MKEPHRSKRAKILNDPIYGFISIPDPLLLQLIDHPWFQRLRHIKQLGLSHLVYPGALHTRFHHALGAMHLMGEAIEVLRSKGHDISVDEALGLRIAILLHDVGHGPFSHTLEHSLVSGIDHEEISALVMDALDNEFDGALATGIAIFRDEYPKKALHQLVSSQLDMDRLDYLNRDSFYTGVSEGIVGWDRIIKMLEIVDDELVVEAKAIYSIEKFLVARRLMYWQVYLHKTVVAAEQMLVQTLRRAKHLAQQGTPVFCAPHLERFLKNPIDRVAFTEDPDVLFDFLRLDDHDIMGAVKVWCDHEDVVLRELASSLIERRTLKIHFASEAVKSEEVEKIRKQVADELGISEVDAEHFVISGSIVNHAYDTDVDRITVLFKDGSLKDIAKASDNLNIMALSGKVEKWFLARRR